jgi:hypothetical protein
MFEFWSSFPTFGPLRLDLIWSKKYFFIFVMYIYMIRVEHEKCSEKSAQIFRNVNIGSDI